MTEFEKFALKGRGISSMTLSRYTSVVDGYINPTITEERQLNVAQMDVFSRLMMDRIIFLGVPIDDDVANIIQAQLLFLAAKDPGADITMYLNTPGGQVHSGLAIYDTMQLVRGYLMQKFGLKVTKEDLQAAAESFVAYQYAMYGMAGVPQNLIDSSAENMLQDQNQYRRIEEQCEDNIAIAKVREEVTLNNKKISMEKFNELK